MRCHPSMDECDGNVSPTAPTAYLEATPCASAAHVAMDNAVAGARQSVSPYQKVAM